METLPENRVIMSSSKGSWEKRENGEAEGIKDKQVLQKHFFLDCQGDRDMFFDGAQPSPHRFISCGSPRTNKMNLKIHSENIMYYMHLESVSADKEM